MSVALVVLRDCGGIFVAMNNPQPSDAAMMAWLSVAAKQEAAPTEARVVLLEAAVNSLIAALASSLPLSIPDLPEPL